MSDSLRKIGHFNKTDFNSPTIISCLVSPKSSQKKIIGYTKHHLTRYVSQEPQTFKHFSQLSNQNHQFHVKT